MLRVHESWREETGWMLMIAGFAGFEYGIINLLANLGLPESGTLTLLIMLASAVAFFAGLTLHMTRPSKREDDAAAPKAVEDKKATPPTPVQHA